MKYRSKMNRGTSRRDFRNKTAAHPKNFRTNPMRGGIRL